MARPALHAWSGGVPRLAEVAVARDDPDPNAVACYGVLVRATDAPEQQWLRFVDARPVSAVLTQFLAWCSETLAPQGRSTLVQVWDNAAWHVSAAVRAWLREHNQRVHRAGGVRIIPCYLPVKSPWLNPIEPTWGHAKRRITEPARLLSARELEERVCAAVDCPRTDHSVIPQEVA